MAARLRPRVLGLAPGASGIRRSLAEFRAGGSGVVTALNTQLLKCAADLMDGDDDELRLMSFAELVKVCLDLCDEQPKNQASHALFVAALARACEDLESGSPLAGSARFTGFHRALASTWNELYEFGVTSDHLESAAAELPEEVTEKLRSMAALERGAREILTGLGFESLTDQVDRSLECIPGKGKLPRVLVLAGAELQPSAAKWLKWLSSHGFEVVVGVDAPLEDVGLFSSSRTFAGLLDDELSVSQGVGVNELCKALFSDRVADGRPMVRINSCSDSLAEAEWALRGCLGDVQLGLKPEEIAIYTRDLEAYACPLESAAKRFDVPLKMSRRVPVLTNRFARLVLEALEFCASDDPRMIISMLGCTYLGLDRKMANDIRSESRVAYKAKKNAWPVFTGWAESRTADIPWLTKVLQWRQDSVRSPQTLRAWSARLQVLIDALPWHGSSTQGPTMSRDMRVPTALRRAIRNMASVRAIDSEQLFTLQDFTRLCRRIWKDEEYSIPSIGNGIAVVNSAQRLGEVRSVYAIGMLEGVFPRRRTEDPILTDEERRDISRVLKLEPPLPTSVERAGQERDEFYRLCAAAKDSLTLSYPQADDTRDNVPAFYLHEVQRVMCDNVAKHDYPRIPIAPERGECLAAADRAMRQSLDAQREDPLPVQFLTKEVRDQLGWPAEEPFTPQDLRDALRCEFRHFASKRLALKPNRESSRWLKLQAIPRSVRLLQQPTKEAAQQVLETALDAEIDTLYGEIPDWELALLKSGGRRLIAEWLQREFLARQLWPKDEQTVKVDLPFGAPGIRNLMPGDVPLQGHVAGVSRMGPYAVTHLYENQPPKRDSVVEGGPLAEIDVMYYGLHLLARHGQGRATAVEVESMQGSRTLLVLPRVADMALPSRHQEGLNVVDLSGGSDGPLAQKAFFDEVKRRLKRAVQRLQQSGVQPIPGEHCTWCAFGELCRRSHEYSEEESPFGPDENDYEVD